MSDLMKNEPVVVPVERKNAYQAPVFSPSRVREEITLAGSYAFFLRLLSNYKWLILGVVLALTGTTAIQLFTMSPLYRATASLQIEPRQTSVLPYEGLFGTGSGSDSYFKTQTEILQSQLVAERVVERLNLATDPDFIRPRDRGWILESISSAVTTAKGLLRSEEPELTGSPDVEKLARKLALSREVKPLPGTQLVEVTLSALTPELAARLANGYVLEFIRLNEELELEEIENGRDFLATKVGEAQGELEESQGALIAYARKKDILQLDPDLTIPLQRLSDLDRQLTEVESQLLESQASLEGLKNATPQNFPPSLTTDTIRELQVDLNELRQEKANLEAQFGENWPETKRVNVEIREAERLLYEERERAIEEARSDYRVAAERYRLSAEKLRNQKRLAAQLGEDLHRYNVLQEEVATNQEVYDELQRRFKQVSVAASLDVTNARMIGDARLPERPYFPNTSQYLLLSIFLGLAVGIGAALVLESVDNSVKVPEDVERFLEVPCLSLIPNLDQAPDYSGPRLITQTSGKKEELRKSENSTAWEAYRYLKTSLMTHKDQGGSRATLVTSAVPGEGKTTTSVNLSVALAQSGLRTILIDLNLHNPKIGGVFGVPEEGGMRAFLSGSETLHSQVKQTGVANLYLIPAGKSLNGHPAELLETYRLEGAMDLLSQFFDAIIVDTPAVLTHTDALILSRKVQDVVMVVNGGETRVEAVQKAVNRLRTLDANILGAVINGVDIRKPEYAYDYGRQYGT